MFGIPDAEADESFLQQSLAASTLSLDMDDQGSTLHAKRELTSCGQNGNELSGGQQARVALARCIYASLAGKLPQYRWHLGCILLKMSARWLLTGSPTCTATRRRACR